MSSDMADAPATPTNDAYVRMEADQRFTELRRRFRAFAFPMTAAFLAWYLLYVLLSTYAHDFMSTQVFGNVNLGILLGLGQFVSTFLITQLYVRYSGRTTDPIADEMRERLEARDFSTNRSEGATRG